MDSNEGIISRNMELDTDALAYVGVIDANPQMPDANEHDGDGCAQFVGVDA